MADLAFQITEESLGILRHFAATAFNPDVFTRLVRASFEQSGAIIAGEISKRMRAGGTLRRRTGTLARSVAGGSVVDGQQIGLRVGILKGPALAYAGPQEFGTKGKAPDSPYPTIRPVRKKFLTIPTDAGGALTPAGVSRYVTARDFPRALTLVRGASGIVNGRRISATFGLYQKSDVEDARSFAKSAVHGLRDKASAQKAYSRAFRSAIAAKTPVYLLAKSVDLRPRRYLRDGLAAGLAGAEKALIEDLQRVFNG